MPSQLLRHLQHLLGDKAATFDKTLLKNCCCSTCQPTSGWCLPLPLHLQHKPTDHRQRRPDNLSLQAAYNTPISTYGTLTCWIFFIVGDVKTPIYTLLMDVRNHHLVDSLTQITVNCILTHESSPSPAMLPKQTRNEYEAILQQFPSLLQPSGAPKQPVQHTVTHHIETTGPPLRARARRLPPQKLITARQEFDHMLERPL